MKMIPILTNRNVVATPSRIDCDGVYFIVKGELKPIRNIKKKHVHRLDKNLYTGFSMLVGAHRLFPMMDAVCNVEKIDVEIDGKDVIKRELLLAKLSTDVEIPLTILNVYKDAMKKAVKKVRSV